MALRIPSPVALTKPEAYLAYKAGILSRGELKDKLLNPINNYEGWLAKWCELLETYPTNEDGTPQCLTDEEGLLAYLCGVTNRYPASNSNPDDARVSAYIRYLVSARYARPDHPLNREEFYLSLIKTQFIPSGDPSSDIVIDGTTKAPFLDVKMYGDTLQNSYSGKNLWDGVFGQGQTYNPSSQTRITTTQSPLLTSGQTYTVSAFNLPSGFRYAVALYTNPAYPGSNPGTAVYDSSWKTSESFTFTAEGDYYFSVVMSKTDNSGITPSEVSNVNFQLEKGSTATDYEPYVGGIPAPNPSYPQPISVVTGENTVKVLGKNLWGGLTTFERSGSGMTWTNNANGSVTASGTATAATSSVSSTSVAVSNNWFITLPSGSYVASAGNLPSGVLLQLFRAKDGSSIGNAQGQFTLTEPTQVYARIRVESGTTLDTTFNIQIETGSTATDYEPYTAQDFEVNLGKNLFDVDTAVTRFENLSGTAVNNWGTYQDGIVTNKQSNGEFGTCAFAGFKPTLVEGKTYTLSATIRLSGTNATNQIRFGTVRNSPNMTVSGKDVWLEVSKTFVATATDVSDSRVDIQAANTGNIIEIKNIQLEKGALTAYAPYFAPLELAGVGEIQPNGLPKYCDIIKQIDDKWYIEKQVGKTTLDGSEGYIWNYNSGTYSGFYRTVDSILTDGIAKVDDARLSKSNNFTCESTATTWTGPGRFGFSSTWTMWFELMDNTITTYRDFNTWLSTHPTTIYYPLATPTTTEITNQALIDQLNALKQGGAEDGTTYIRVSATDPNLPAKLYVEAPKYD